MNYKQMYQDLIMTNFFIFKYNLGASDSEEEEFLSSDFLN